MRMEKFKGKEERKRSINRGWDIQFLDLVLSEVLGRFSKHKLCDDDITAHGIAWTQDNFIFQCVS